MGSLLSSLGARVIKVEPPGNGDPARTVSPWGFLNYNWGKSSLSLDLKSGDGQKILYELIRKADIFIENMRPRVPESLGFSYQHLRKINPALIYCSIKGFSAGSRDHDKPAFDAVAQAMSGIMSLTGEPDGEPLRVGNPSVDLGAAAYGTIEVVAAVLDRQRSGRGKFIEVPLLEMSVYWNGYWITYYGMTGRVPARLGSSHPGYSPHKVFRTRDGKYFLIATLSDAQWKKVSETLGLSLGPEFAEMRHRLAHRVETENAIQEAIAKLDSIEVLTKLGKVVPCAPVRSIDEIYRDDELYQAGVLRDTIYRISGREHAIRIATSPLFGYAEHSKKDAMVVPQLGENTETILRWLGHTPSQIRKFRQQGIL